MPVRQSIERLHPTPSPARRPSSAFRLSAGEKKLLKNPAWIDEEEAALIRAMREEKKHGLKGENIRDFAKRYGRDVEDLAWRSKNNGR